MKQQINIKRANGQILAVNRIFEKKRETLNNYGVWLRYTSRSGVHNMYKEYRDMTRTGAVRQMYQEMAGRHRARWSTIQIIRVDTVASNQLRRVNTKQFIDSAIKFPLPHRVVRPASRKFRKTFAAARPNTFYG